MKATFISKEKNSAKFTMVFTPEEFEDAIVKAYKKNKNNFTVNGFRQGKAPRKVIESNYGEDVFFEEAINQMLTEKYPVAIQELELKVVDRPTISFSDIKKDVEITATIDVPVYPEITVEGYKGVEFDKIVKVVSEEDLQKELEGLQKRNSRMIVADRPAENGDTLLLNYSGSVDGVDFEGGTAENQTLKLGSGTFIPGFEEQLVGVKAGEDKDVKVTFPSEYHAPDLAGKEAVFKCKVHEVKFEEIPALDDEFAKDISEFDTLEELKADLKSKMGKNAETIALEEMKNLAVEKVLEKNEFDIPNGMVEDEIDNIVRVFDQQLQYQGLNLTQYLQYTGKPMEEFRHEMREEATKKAKFRVIIQAVADQENIEVTDEEVSKEIKDMSSKYNLDEAKIREMMGEGSDEAIKFDIKMRKSVDLMYDNAKIK